MSAVLAGGCHYHLEVIDGREVEKPALKKLHILIQTYLIIALNRMLPPRYRALPELNVLTGGTSPTGRREYIVPDIQVVERAARYEDGDLAEPPIWGMEILSPGQTIGDLFVRSERLLKLGAPLTWVIWPERRKAWMYSPTELIEAVEELSAMLADGTEPDSIHVKLAEIWDELD